jgi:hypothetical protein
MGVTALETLSVGVPVVTFPGRQSVHSLVHGMNQKMNLSDFLCANSKMDYVLKAVLAAGTTARWQDDGDMGENEVFWDTFEGLCAFFGETFIIADKQKMRNMYEIFLILCRNLSMDVEKDSQSYQLCLRSVILDRITNLFDDKQALVDWDTMLRNLAFSQL